MSAAAAHASARRIAWARRRRALAALMARVPPQPARDARARILVAAVAMALAAPLIADEAGLRAINTTQNPTFASPARVSAARHGQPRARHAHAVRVGSANQPPRGPHRHVLAVLIGSIVGISAGFFGGWVGGILMRFTEWFLVIPFLPLAIVLAAILGPVGAKHHPRHRDHVVAVPRPPDPRPGAHPEGTRLRRPQPRARRVELAPHDAPHPAERLAAHPRQPHAHGADRDPLRDDAVVPRARRPAQPVLGQAAATTPSRPAP